MKSIKEEWTQKRIVTSPHRQKIAAILNDPDFIAKYQANKRTRTKIITRKPKSD